MEGSIAMIALIFLGAAIIMVPIVKRLGLSSVIGYILGGIIIGPFVLKLTGRSADNVMHATEFGVIMMLFLVGLELDPKKLWAIRKRILGLGLSQLLLSILFLFAIFYFAGWRVNKAFVIAMCFALSSTAIVLQTLKEKNLFRTASGEASFSILLFQDIAVIPILALLPIISPLDTDNSHEKILLQYLPDWLQPFSLIVGITALILLGRYIFVPFLRFVSKSGMNELLTASSLFLVIGVSELMISVGLSPALGAFIAGVMLANSEFRHELESQIDPFKGLLLAVFFVSVGSTINFSIIKNDPIFIFSTAFAVLFVKALILFGIAKYYKMNNNQSFFIAFALSQVGEFAFVLVNFSTSLYLIDKQTSAEMLAIVAITMCITPFLLMFKERFLDDKFNKEDKGALPLEPITQRKIIIVGFGYFGSTVGRLLRANGIRATVLDSDPDRIALLRSNGFNVYYGDATKNSLLRAAGIEEASLLILCLDDPEKNKLIVEWVHENFPKVKIFVRAKNRLDAYDFINNGVDNIYRETLGTAVDLAVDVLKATGMRSYAARRMGKRFMLLDKASTKKLAKQKVNDIVSFGLRESLEREAELLAYDSISFDENYWSEDDEEDHKTIDKTNDA
ncbi:monovalent cation:proton antiporter-2 (CPA2) family protein [Soonwooa sp.]|uniref:monovalent cation:proton antiporter-2 (CPA2) family protein n=1 Tax=Soonwooa sp. TaxID=1938592 RepID=UPI0028ADB534|nr:monovalent cation:proton antiporter-2 (CPA2) family protein [Soonwooa sp.]